MLLDTAENPSVAGREESIVTDTDKPVRQYVLGQSSLEIVNSNVGDFVLPTTSVILVIEGNMRVSDIQYPGICNGLYKCILKDRADIAGSDRLRSYSPAMALEHEVITGEMLSVDTQQGKQLGRNESPVPSMLDGPSGN